MLLEFSCSNHLSIRKKIIFSALAGKDTTNEEKLIDFNGMKVLRSGVVYGANGSGKSNLIDALAFVQNLVLTSINNQPGDSVWQKPHKLGKLGDSSEYSIQFVFDGIRYAYSFTLEKSLVCSEYLYYFPKGRQTKIFERISETEFEEGSKFKGKLDTCRDILKPNRLLLSCAANFSKVKEVEKVFAFFRDNLVIYAAGEQSESWLNYSLHQISQDAELKKAVIQIMQGLGVGLKDLDITIQKQDFPIDINDMPDFLSDDAKRTIIASKIDRISAKVVYDQFATDLLMEESTGVKKLFSFLCPLIDIVSKNKILICDELETSLHESIVHGILASFLELQKEKTAQLFFTTHDTSLLDLNLFRRDQIWFVELNEKDRSTELFSLAEMKNIRKDERFGKCYISGRYGAIPMLNIHFADIVSSLK